MMPIIRVKREADEVMLLVPILYKSVGQCYEGLLQLVRSRFSNLMCPKNEVS